MERWRLLDLEYEDPYMNMAVDEAVLKTVEAGAAPNTVRFWMNQNAIIIGRFQDVSEVNTEACIRFCTPIVRRFTGGGAVYHDRGNLNWTIVVDKSHPLLSKDVFSVYSILCRPIVEGLKLLNIDAEFKSPNSIQVNKKKISGMAMYVGRRAILCHGTLLVSTDLNLLSELLNVSNKMLKHPKAGKKLSTHVEVTTIQRESGTHISIVDVKKSIMEGFQKLYRIKLDRGRLKEREEELSRQLYEQKYSRVKWSLQPS